MKYFPFFLLLMISACQTSHQSNNKNMDTHLPPEWSENQIWYQIFVERFYNGDPDNDPTPESIVGAWPYKVPEDWSVTPWTHDWYSMEAWSEKSGNDFYHNSQLRRYGGDLQGVIDKLDYLQKLGVTAIYFNPLNHAPSLHKFDASTFHHIDANFGPDPKKDLQIMAEENPNNPESWQWTTADKLFLELIKQAHQRNMKVIVDFSWNHTGLEFWAWKDILEKGADSEYADWYRINQFDDPNTEENEFDYEGWLGFKSLPELKKVNVENRKHGYPYQGNIYEEVKQHIFDVTKRWLAPNGETEHGIDGFRLDVADQIPMDFWKEYRAYVKSIEPNAYLVGEIWWAEFPDKLMNPRPYLGEAAFDAVMFYQAFRPARQFFGENEKSINAEEFEEELKAAWEGMPEETIRGMMGLNASHDTPRLTTSFHNTNQYKVDAKTTTENNYHSGKPSKEAVLRSKLYLLHQFTSISSPHIWNGDEMGMWGADDPDDRKPLWWPEYEFENESAHPALNSEESYEVGFDESLFNYYQSLIQLRKKYSSLYNGEFKFLKAEGQLLIYERKNKKETTIVAFNVGNEPITTPFSDADNYSIAFEANDGGMIVNDSLHLQSLSGVFLVGN